VIFIVSCQYYNYCTPRVASNVRIALFHVGKGETRLILWARERIVPPSVDIYCLIIRGIEQWTPEEGRKPSRQTGRQAGGSINQWAEEEEKRRDACSTVGSREREKRKGDMLFECMRTAVISFDRQRQRQTACIISCLSIFRGDTSRRTFQK
jgi:hypothetical protein